MYLDRTVRDPFVQRRVFRLDSFRLAFRRRAACVLALALVLSSLPGSTALAQGQPDSVTVAGDLQQELGCSGDWQPDCADTHLSYDAGDEVWQGTFNVPAGDWQYKAPINDSWDENYGLNATQGGANIPLSLDAPADVKFYYSHATHWITDNVNSLIATAPGSFQSELGCPGDWQPDCLRSWLQDPDGDGIFGFITDQLPAGGYEVKVAHAESWDVNFGAGGVQGGANIPFTVDFDCQATDFTYDPVTHLLDIRPAATEVQPSAVTIAGSLQSELGCPGDWQPDCAATHLNFDAEDGVWQATFNVPAGGWEYKAPINNTWDENYGLNATRGGANIPLSLDAPTDVKFYYSDDTHWVTDNVNSIIATAAGSFQEELGCSGDWQPWCLRSWLQDPDGNGFYTFSSHQIPPGNYEVKVALYESWDLNYGAGGAQNGANIAFTVPAACVEIFFTYDSTTNVLTVGTEAGGPTGNLALAQAHWLAGDLIAWDLGAAAADFDLSLAYAANGGLSLGDSGIAGADGLLTLSYDDAGLPADVLDKFPHLAGYEAFRLDADDLALVPAILKGQFAVQALGGDGTPVDATSVQLPGVLDDLYSYSGPLGLQFGTKGHGTSYGGDATLYLWAPTAQAVRVHLYDTPSQFEPTASQVASYDDASGVWSTDIAADDYGKYFLYEVQVYAPSTGAVETNFVTDPYSVSLAGDSVKSQILDLRDPATQPADWAGTAKPYLRGPQDAVLYELHVRDFSAVDPDVSVDALGRFTAFTEDTFGRRHLQGLAAAGVTHVHLLPAFDIATVPERRADQVEPDFDVLAALPADSDQQQEIIEPTRDQDAFNWGYDPWHYTVPEGSYATDPDGPARVREFRAMVQALNEDGLRVVMDVVYNHTNAAGQNAKSVLDRIVPGYYHRLNADGNIETSSCCPNTASEHAMMERLMVDSLVTWARDYKVDGFRFDLMGHHMLRNLQAVRAALDALTLEADGVDGSRILIYGEGWNFGEVADGARGINAIQANVAGTGIGTFNDRIRDSVRGGGPFAGKQEQGFANGLYFDPNATDQGSAQQQLDLLLLLQDRLRVSLAGNLAGYPLIDRTGAAVTGADVPYGNNAPSGYTQHPYESINYVSAHDNETLFDDLQYKLPIGTHAADRARAQVVALSTVALAQGIPFFHAGSEILRSKSLDRDSFNSGDWFNKLDTTLSTNNWGVGLPPASHNQASWPLMLPLLADPSLSVTPSDITFTLERFQELMQIRRGSRLFRLSEAADVAAAVDFHNTGPSQLPGLVAMSLSDPVGTLDPGRSLVVVLFNANDAPQDLTVSALTGADLALHPVQAGSFDPIVQNASFDASTGTFSIPGRTTAVFQVERDLALQVQLLELDVEALFAAGGLSRGERTQLVALLRSVQRQLTHGQAWVARQLMRTFLRRVELLYRKDSIDLDTREDWQEKGQAIQTRLGS